MPSGCNVRTLLEDGVTTDCFLFAFERMVGQRLNICKETQEPDPTLSLCSGTVNNTLSQRQQVRSKISKHGTQRKSSSVV